MASVEGSPSQQASQSSHPGSTLPPDWHLICCDEDHGSSSQSSLVSGANIFEQQGKSSTRPGLKTTGSYAWTSCCEDETCVSPSVNDHRQQRQPSYGFTGVQQPHQRNIQPQDKGKTTRTFREQVSPLCCPSTTNSIEQPKDGSYRSYDHRQYQMALGIGAIMAKANVNAGAGFEECPPGTVCCDSPHVIPTGISATSVGYPNTADGSAMDCSEEGCCDLDEFLCQDHHVVGACAADYGIRFGEGVNLNHNANNTSQTPFGGFPNVRRSLLSAGASPASRAGIAAPLQQPNKVSFEALLSAVVQDALRSGALPTQNTTLASNPTSMPSPSAVAHTPGPVSTSHTTHARTSSLQMQTLHNQQQEHYRAQSALQRNQQVLHAQLTPSAIIASPIPLPSDDRAGELSSHPSSRRPSMSRASSPMLTQNISSQSGLSQYSQLSLTSPSNATMSGNGNHSSASSVLQTPSPLLDVTPRETSVMSRNDITLDDSTFCSAKKSTRSDCNDHAHVRGKPVLHVCHWQNCHSSFSTVQGLLQHISQSHLGLSVGETNTASPSHGMTGGCLPTDIDISQKATLQEGDRADVCSQLPNQAVYATADVSSSNPQSISNSATLMSATGGVSIPLPLSMAAVEPESTNVSRNYLLDSSLNYAARQQQPEGVAKNMAPFGIAGNFMNNANQDMQTFAAQVEKQDSLQSVLGVIGLDGSRGGPMACLWDDCPPFDPFAHFGQQCLDNACGLPPMTGGQDVNLAGLEAVAAVDATTLTCDPACTQEHTHLFPCDPTCSQEHAHIHPMHLHSYSQNHPSSAHNVQLDSATAVLKHLLQQHLGVDLTQGLLNVASQQLEAKPLQPAGVISDDQLQSQDISQKTGTMAEATLTSRQRTTDGSNSSVPTKKLKLLKAPPRGPSDIQLAQKQTHVCRWHNCSKTFESVEDLTEHLSEVHVGKGKTEYECLWAGCEICDQGHNGVNVGESLKGRKFTTRQKVMRHMQAHTGYRPFVCPICGAAVSEQATLLAHIRRHSEDRPFACDADGCDKTFASAASLAVHKRTHDGQKEHICPHCDKGFLEVSNMNKHIRTHTGERPFKCKEPGCMKKFSRPDQLKRHAQIHDRGKNSNAAFQPVASGTDESP